MSTMTMSLLRHQYISLTTFRRDGSRVSTPVWFALDSNDHVVIWTDAGSGKIKRLRADHRVTVAPCDVRGRVSGDEIHGRARILPAEDAARAQALLDRRYGLQKRLYTAAIRAWRSLQRRPRVPAAYIDVDLTQPAAGEH
jgi:uncharacterized protein